MKYSGLHQYRSPSNSVGVRVTLMESRLDKREPPQEEQRLLISSSMRSVLSQDILRSLLFFKYFDNNGSRQESTSGTTGLTSRAFLVSKTCPNLTSRPVYNLKLSRLFPVVVVASLPTILDTTATSLLGLFNNDW